MEQVLNSAPVRRGGSNGVTLRMGVSHVRRGVPYVRELIKLSVRAHWQRSLTSRWLGILNSHPFLGTLAGCAPHLLHKVYRPYMSNTLCSERRLSALEQHYRFVIERGLDGVVLQAARGGMLLASFDGKCGAPYEVWLRAVAPLEREGELVLQLRTGQSLVYSLAFSFCGAHGRHVVNVGCLQGPRGETAPDLIRSSTRSLHGLRPKNLLIGLVRQIGQDLGCTHLHLVGNGNRVVHSAIRQGKVTADYDQAWEELGALRRPDGDFELACRALAPPALDEVESKRRSELRKRHALCGAVHAAVGERLCGRAAQPYSFI